MTPRGGKEQTGRDPTPGRNTRQDGLEVKHSEEPQLPTIHCCQSRHLSHSSTAPGVWKGGQVGARRRKSTSSGRGCPAAQHDSAVVSNDQEQWHKPAVPRAQTSATCRVRPLELLRSPHRDGGVKVPPDQGRVGIVGGHAPAPPGHLAGALPHKGPSTEPNPAPGFGQGSREASPCSLSHAPGKVGVAQLSLQVLQQRLLALPGPGGHEGVSGGRRKCNRWSHRVSLSLAEFPLGSRDAELKPPAVWTWGRPEVQAGWGLARLSEQSHAPPHQ